MRDLSPLAPCIPAMSADAIGQVRRLESEAIQRQQIPIATSHVLHGGMYARTILIPAGVLITGVLVKVATMLIIQGDATVYVGDGEMRFTGYMPLTASAGRKQAFAAHADTYLTMIFPTAAKTVDDAERQFTDEFDLLASHRDDRNHVLITGE
jgi:hypothetical protein